MGVARSLLRQPAALFGLAVVTVVVVLALAAPLIAPFAADALAIRRGEGDVSLLGSAVILVAAQVGMLVVGYFGAWRPRALAALPLFPGREPLAAVVAGFGWGVLARVGSAVVLYVVALLLTAIGQPPQPEPAQRAMLMLDPLLVVIAIAVFAPIAEELFFRGIVFNAWRREAGRRWAYVGSAALFALIHFSLVSLLPIFLLGLALAWVYERTGNLLAPIAMHMTVNSISVAIVLAARFGDWELPVAIIGW